MTYYKSPDDSLSVDDFYKVYGYTCFYKADVRYVNSIPADELTITFVAEKYPRKMIEHLKNVKKYRVEEKEKGIYYVYGDLIPIQILITKKLSAEENLWLKSLTNMLNEAETAEKLIENYMDHKESSLHRSMIETIMRANQKRVLPAFKICFADGGQAGNQFASQIGYKLSGGKWYERYFYGNRTGEV